MFSVEETVCLKSQWRQKKNPGALQELTECGSLERSGLGKSPVGDKR